ncbi:helix-turn-helix domain-containing protein [Abiotrophia defectiva]|uniref:helix-turn-helix domain-containing protein n=1 Tax=Abiotrophia defectiva TaxID=46125 RepID=UPI0022824272|nr:helix-turn-helix transcriptional regulator [Abiotrophia defectiva]MCY7224990.1 helix-turn-helix domain-containing protein [Abiotrophia defectiva]
MAKKDYDTVAIGSRIRSIRQAKGMTLEEFGNLFSASKSIASRWEKGISIPNADRLKSIAKIGDTTVEELLHGNKEQFIRQTAIELIRQYREDIRNGAPGKEAYLERYGEELSKRIVNLNLDYLLEVDRERVADALQESIDNHIENAYTSPEDYFNSTFDLEMMLYHMRRDAGLESDLVTKNKRPIEGVDVEAAKQVISIIQDAIDKINELRMKYGL